MLEIYSPHFYKCWYSVNFTAKAIFWVLKFIITLKLSKNLKCFQQEFSQGYISFLKMKSVVKIHKHADRRSFDFTKHHKVQPNWMPVTLGWGKILKSVQHELLGLLRAFISQKIVSVPQSSWDKFQIMFKSQIYQHHHLCECNHGNHQRNK